MHRVLPAPIVERVHAGEATIADRFDAVTVLFSDLYEIWGDTVNMASRIESYSELDRIHVSAEVAHALADDFDLESRGVMDIRGKGEVETFILNGRK